LQKSNVYEGSRDHDCKKGMQNIDVKELPNQNPENKALGGEPMRLTAPLAPGYHR
jgi:hypothetical protein